MDGQPTPPAWTSAELTEYDSPITGQNLSGHAVPNVPRYNGDFEVAWRPVRRWFAAGQLAAVGRTFYDEINTPLYEQHAYTLLVFRAGYEAARWSVTLYGENLGNQGYYEVIIPGVNSANPGAPRTEGIEAALKW